MEANPIWRILLVQLAVFADSFARLTAGSSRPASTAITPITTSSSISVKPPLPGRVLSPPHFDRRFLIRKGSLYDVPTLVQRIDESRAVNGWGRVSVLGNPSRT